VALQGYLSKVVSRMRGVRAANVMIAKPEHQGFGRTTAKPSASVMVEMRGGGEVGRDMVEAIASLVSGAVAEMNPQDVEVIDALGHSYRIDDPEDRIPTEALELVRSQEAYYQDKIERLLMIPGVIVAASVDLDPVRKEHSNTTTYTDTEPVLSESVTEVVTKDFSAGGEPGARSNAGADIASGSGVAREHSESATKTEFGSKLPVGTTVKEIAGHQIQKINVTINVPRNYFVGIYQARTPDAGAAPDEATLQPIIDEQLARITEKVEPVITKGDAKGVIKASMYFDPHYLTPATAGGGGVLPGGVTQWAGPGLASVAVVLALGAMFYLVRRTTQEEDLPTVEELAGVPKALPADDDLLGEAEEVESTMAGVEVDEAALQARKVSEQISELIKSSPKEAGSLLGKWVAVDD